MLDTQGLGDAGGYLSFLLFRRRINKKLSLILSTCYFFKNYGQEPDQLRINEEIIKITSEFKEKIKGIKGEKSQRTSLVLQTSGLIIAIISSSVIIASLGEIIKPLSGSGILYQLNSNIGIIYVLVYGVLLALFYRYWDGPKKWYDKMILINNIDYKEIQVTDYLALLQSNVISRMSAANVTFAESISSMPSECECEPESIDAGITKNSNNLPDRMCKEGEQNEIKKPNNKNTN